MVINQRPDIVFGDEVTNKDKVFAKFKENPMVPIGLSGLLGIVGYMGFKFRSRDKTQPMSVYLIRTRLYAQGFATGCLVMFATYQMYQTLTKPKNDEKEKK